MVPSTRPRCRRYLEHDRQRAQPVADRLAKLSGELKACPFAAKLDGDGKPHITEKNGTPNAIDWKDPAAKVVIELLAEGQDVSITVSKI